MMNLHIPFLNNEKNLSFKNPILTASGTFGFGIEFMPYGNIRQLGGIVVKGLSLEARAGNNIPRITETSCGMLNAVGLQNDGVQYFIEHTLPLLPYTEVPIITNIYGKSVDEFAQLALILSQVEGIAALEVNISCPNVLEGGVLFGQDPKLAAQVTEAVKKNSGDLPVIVKLTPNVTNIGEIAKAAESAGADALSLINTLSGMAVDIKTRKPILANIIGGLSGPAIKPVALRCLYETRKAVKLPLIGIGGICNAYDVLEFLLLGASAVQIGTANFLDPSIAFKIINDLPILLEELGYKSIADFTQYIYS